MISNIQEFNIFKKIDILYLKMFVAYKGRYAYGLRRTACSMISHTPKASFCKVKLPANDRNLMERDEQIASLINEEIERQRKSLILTASENFTSKAVMQAVGSPLMNKYSEGYPERRYYGGWMVVDKIEQIWKQRALTAFNANPDQWDVNVQALSGAPANFIVFTGLIPPGGKIMALDTEWGGHPSHGYQKQLNKISASSLFWDCKSYGLKKDGSIDYEGAYELAQTFKPNMIVWGYSVHTKDLDYKRFREIADSVGAYLLADVSHISAFIACGLLNSPFEYVDIVVTTTHKALRGPRGSLIFHK